MLKITAATFPLFQKWMAERLFIKHVKGSTDISELVFIQSQFYEIVDWRIFTIFINEIVNNQTLFFKGSTGISELVFVQSQFYGIVDWRIIRIFINKILYNQTIFSRFHKL